MNASDPKHEPQRSDAIIRRAFYRSLAAIVLLALAGLLLYWLLGREQPAQEAVEEAVVTGPVTETGVAPQTPPVVNFTDITKQAGIDFVHVNGAYGGKLIPEAIGSGAAFFDYDNDGDPDLLLVNSSYWPGHEGDEPAGSALYRNNADGTFTDVTTQAGLDLDIYGMGVAVADYDSDGWIDVYITALGRNHLFRNNAGTFTDVTDASDTAGPESDWSTVAAFLDYDNDNDLDLLVGNYVEWSREIDLEIDFRVTGLGRAIGRRPLAQFLNLPLDLVEPPADLGLHLIGLFKLLARVLELFDDALAPRVEGRADGPPDVPVEQVHEERQIDGVEKGQRRLRDAERVLESPHYDDRPRDPLGIRDDLEKLPPAHRVAPAAPFVLASETAPPEAAATAKRAWPQ